MKITPAKLASALSELDFVTDAELISALLSFVKLADFTGENQLLSESGYQRLPGGLIFQWGQTNNSAAPTATFPIAFNSFVRVMVTPSEDWSATSIYMGGATANAPTLTGFTGKIVNGNNGGPRPGILNYIAIGK